MSKRRFDDRQRQHRLPGAQERRLCVEPLQHFLHDRKTRHDVVKVDQRLELDAGRFSEDLDPDRRINEDHDDGFCTRFCLRAWLIDLRAIGLSRPGPESVWLWPAGPSRARRARLCESTFVPRSHASPPPTAPHQAQDLYAAYTWSVACRVGARGARSARGCRECFECYEG